MQGKESKKRALIVATISGFVPQFVMNNVYILQEKGYEVHYASNFNNVHFGLDNNRLNGTGVVRHQVDFVRSPFKIMANIRAYRQLRKVMKETFYDMVHCHTPMGAVLARVTAKPYRKKGTKVFYTAHGFHFYKGAPMKNWLFFYPVEKWLSRYTDVLITINKEDYACAKTFCREKVTKVEYIPGVGIDIKKIRECADGVDRSAKRKELGLQEDDFVVLNVAELIKRKNQRVILEALKELKERHPEVKLLLCGNGPTEPELECYVKENGLEEQVRFLGYRTDVFELCGIADCFVLSSLHEGLSVALMEAMAAGLPIICSEIRGNVDLAEPGENWHLVKSPNGTEYAEKIETVLRNHTAGKDRKTGIDFKYDEQEISKHIERIYTDNLRISSESEL